MNSRSYHCTGEHPMLAKTLERTWQDAIERLPEGGAVEFQPVSWSEYERLLSEMDATGRRRRVTYDRGRLEITAPLRRHEFSGQTINDLIRVAARKLRIKVEASGSMTIRRPDLQQGVEPDRCYHVQSAGVVIGKGELDFRTDPAPDLAVEIDVTSESLSKFKIYAALGVGEIWRLHDDRIEFYALREGSYLRTETSEAFPFLDPATLASFLEIGRTEGQDEAIDRFEAWLGQNVIP